MQVRDLGLDDFDAAQDLVRRGAAEGYLAPRSAGGRRRDPGRRLRRLRRDAPPGRHLRAAPEPRRHAAELASLYALTRFLGEGVGGHLVAFALERARELGKRYVFACTTQERIAAFFVRYGFREVAHDEVPASKWADYDAERKARVRCFRFDL